MLPKKNYPSSLQVVLILNQLDKISKLNLIILIYIKDKLEKLQSFIENISSEPREHLKCLHKKPVPSKQFEPKITTK